MNWLFWIVLGSLAMLVFLKILICVDDEKLPPDDDLYIPVKGLLSYFFPLNADITEEVAKSIVGLPIKDSLGNVIGKVSAINWESGEWYGLITTDGSIREQLLKNVKNSMEIVIDKEEA